MADSRWVVVFDMDGVLVDPTGSYRQTVVETVAHFGGHTDFASIEDCKNQGGFNNDWKLTQQILADQGITVAYEHVIERFKKLFFGTQDNGLCLREEWLVGDGLLQRLATRNRLAIFTGRLAHEAGLTLRRFAPAIEFAPVVCADHVTRGKPAPDGLLQIQAQFPGERLVYLGDTVDDSLSARQAKVPFVGVAKRGHARRQQLVDLFTRDGAARVIEHVDEIEQVLEELA
jgi:HAD superfamily hydrolase (TIGR01548 family)